MWTEMFMWLYDESVGGEKNLLSDYNIEFQIDFHSMFPYTETPILKCEKPNQINETNALFNQNVITSVTCFFFFVLWFFSPCVNHQI